MLDDRADKRQQITELSDEKALTPNNTKVDLSTFEDLSELVEKLALNLDSKSEQKFRDLISQKMIVDREIAKKFLKQSFRDCVGSRAELIYQEVIDCEMFLVETLEDFAVFLNILSGKIEDAKYRQTFQDIVSKNIILDRDLALKTILDSLKKSVGLLAKTIS